MDNITKKLQGLSEQEKKVALEILNQYSKEGRSDIYDSLLYQDYREIPVDIETFLTDDRYLGIPSKDLDGKSKVYPFWMEQLKKLYPDNIHTAVNTFIATGARGLGKSETCVNYIMCYELYRDMCLKNPLDYYHLKKTDKVVYALMNIKLALAEEIARDKFQNTVKQSPWFMERGYLTGRINKIWQPNDEYMIDIKIGSQSDDLIGLPVRFCLDGDTIILTDLGEYKIKDLENSRIKVPSITDDNKVVLSDYCTVVQTSENDIEYEIEMEDNTIIKCTPNHLFRLIDGSYKEAQYLSEEDEILDFKPYGYIYKTTNLINGKIYIGQKRSTSLIKDYIGSGKLIRKAIDKYGKDNFKVEIIEFCKDKKSLDDKEKYYIKKYNSQDIKLGYNIAEDGQGGDLGEVSRKHISEAIKGTVRTEEQKRKISETLKNKHYRFTEDQLRRISLANKNKILSPETRKKISEAAKKRDYSNFKPPTKGKIIINKCRKDLIKYLKENGFENISYSAVRSIEEKSYKKTRLKKFKGVIDNLSWGYKDED